VDGVTSEPMFPLPVSHHRTYVRVVEIDDSLSQWALEGVCRGCGWVSWPPRAFYASAWEDCFHHAQEVANQAGTAWYGRLYDHRDVED
jgi:hypothetical protein